VLPLHPRTRNFITTLGIQTELKLIDPVGYFDMLALLENCKMVLTDSGGLQKEAYFFRKFCLTLRDQTEWTELVESGANEVVGADTNRILESFRKNRDKEVGAKELYGDGNAAGKIVDHLKSL
jgi:UDP-GlcNAc3NAcA epimerase